MKSEDARHHLEQQKTHQTPGVGRDTGWNHYHSHIYIIEAIQWRSRVRPNPATDHCAPPTTEVLVGLRIAGLEATTRY